MEASNRSAGGNLPSSNLASTASEESTRYQERDLGRRHKMRGNKINIQGVVDETKGHDVEVEIDASWP